MKKKPITPAPDVSAAAAALGRIGGKSRSKKKIDAVNQNLIKANNALDSDARKARAKKAAAARWSKAKNDGKGQPET